jgi:hypothetical protein
LVFQVVSFLLTFPPISYMHSSSPPFVLHAPPISSCIQGTRPGPRLLENFRNKLIFYGELLPPRPTPKLEDHPLSAVRDCLFNIFAAALQNWRAYPPSATST